MWQVDFKNKRNETIKSVVLSTESLNVLLNRRELLRENATNDEIKAHLFKLDIHRIQ